MKKLLIAAMALVIINNASAQKIKETEVPAAVKAKFKALYPAITKVKWEKENGAFEAGFDNGKVETSVLIDPSGNLKETEVEISLSALPKAASDYIAKNYAGYKISEAAKITDAKGVVTFEAEVSKMKKGMDVIFDASGKFIKENHE
jgi:hypothetical protein